MIKNCKYCGKEFEAVRKTHNCCSRRCAVRLCNEKKAEEKALPESHLVPNCQAARKLGMSYGKFKAMQYIERMGI